MEENNFDPSLQKNIETEKITRRQFLKNAGKSSARWSLIGFAASLLTRSGAVVETERGEQVNTHDFFFKKRPEGLTGSHRMSQIVEGNKVYYVKHVAEAFEMYTVAQNGDIYLALDHSDPKKPYTFSKGLFLPAQMSVGETIKVQDNFIQRYNELAQPVATNSGKWNYNVTLLEHNPKFNIGGDLGVQDVIVLRYNYFSDYEHFLYSKTWGWIGWELFDKKGTVKQRAIFNEIAEKNILPRKNQLSGR